MKRILITGGGGYIGSHVVAELTNSGYESVILDNFCTSDKSAIKNLEKLVGKSITLYEADYRDTTKLTAALKKESIEGIIHIAAYKAVGDSVSNPLKYYDNNVAGFIGLVETAKSCDVKHIVFSSSAAVYGNPPSSACKETTVCRPQSPYGWSKYMDEIVLRDTCQANPDLRGTTLRYFNVVGSHQSGIIGESSKGKPQNLLPIIVDAVASKVPLTIFGNDYPTTDGTCERDYIHVVDLARAHVAALHKSFEDSPNNYVVYNIGTGKPTSVMELISAFERVNKVPVPYNFGPRRAGDPVTYYAVAEKATHELAWKPEQTIEGAVLTAWKWRKKQTAKHKKTVGYSD